MNYRRLEDELISKDSWLKDKTKILDNLSDCLVLKPIALLLKTMEEEIDGLYKQVNQRIIPKENKNIKVDEDKLTWRLPYKKKEDLANNPFYKKIETVSLASLRREKITIYVGFTDDDMERLSPLLTLFWQQLISVMIKNIPDQKKEPYPLLCLIDEFSSLGRIERLRRSLKLLREYRVRCVLMLQYIAQTYEQYTHYEAKAFTNIKTKIAFAAEDINDAEYISKLLGTRTLRVTAGSASTQTQGHSESKSYTYQAVPLLRPDEVMRLSKHQSLIVRTGYSPVKAGQFIWYQEKIMRNRNLQHAVAPIQKLG